VWKPFNIAIDAFWRFNADEGWALASHIALSLLMALFPFLIFVTSLAALFGSQDMADQLSQLLLETWPAQVAAPIAAELHNVLTNVRTDALTFGVLLAIYFSSSGVESLRIALNRAYELTEERSFWILKLEAIAYVLVGAMGLIALGFLIVLWPLAWALLARFVPGWALANDPTLIIRYTVAGGMLVFALLVIHMWLPAGRRRITEVVPGIVVTIVLWLVTGAAFGEYLSRFSSYVTTYAGLASVMAALVFLYLTASIFIYGGEVNAVLQDERQKAPAASKAKKKRRKKE
jgi:membrane protein